MAGTRSRRYRRAVVPDAPSGPEPFRLAQLLVTLSLVTDLGAGFPPEHAVRVCLLASHLGREMGLSEDEVRAIYWTALLKHVGCTAYAHEQARWVGGDDNASFAEAAIVDFSDTRESMAMLLRLGSGASPLRRARLIGHAVVGSRRWDRELSNAFCDVAAQIARRLELGPEVVRGLYDILERWNGKGGPRGLSGEDIALAARVAQVAEQAILFNRLGGPDDAGAAMRHRAGGWVDPAVAAAFADRGSSLLKELDAGDALRAAVDAEPEPQAWIAAAGLDDVARAFADVADLKSVYTHGHSSAVASLAEAAGEVLGLERASRDALRRAGLLHDLGRVAVPAGTWEREGPLTVAEWEQVRLHAYHSERILSAAPALRGLAPLAGMHHERQDGSGYHRQATAGTIPMPARVLAATDTYRAMTETRAHRRALAPDAAAEAVQAEASAGRLDADAVRAVLEAAGHAAARIRRSWPAGLSDREVEVLVLAAQGLSTRTLAARLFISPKTVEHHIEHIYAKLGVSSRAALALFAMEHDLLAR